MDTALVRGTVKDSSGAVIPGVMVTMTNVATGVSDKRPTDRGGRYLFADLKPATYTATIAATGFKTLIQENIVLRVGQQIDLDLTLEVGEISQRVEVSAESPLLNTVSGALGTEVTGQYMINMPLEGRDYSALVFLAPGTTEVAGGAKGIQLGGTGFVFQRPTLCNGRVSVGRRPGDQSRGRRRRHHQPPIQAHCGVYPGVQAAEQQLLGGVREQRRHHGKSGHEIRDQSVPWQRLLVFPEAAAGCQ